MSEQRKVLEPKYIVLFIIRFSAFISAGSVIFGLLVIFLLNKNIGPTYVEGLSALNQLQFYLPLTILITIFVQALTLCAVGMLLALFWSHNIAGPLVRFRKHLRDIAQGKTLKEPIVFRNGDQLSGLSQRFTEMILAHKNNSTKALALLDQAQKIIDLCEFLKNQGKNDTGEFKLEFKELKRIYIQVKEIYAA